LIDIDEEGGTGAGATSVMGSFFRSLPKPLKVSCDEPFLFMLRDKISKIIFLFGKIANPLVEPENGVFF